MFVVPKKKVGSESRQSLVACELLTEEFIQSRVDLLKSLGVADIFLDNPDNPKYARSQFALGEVDKEV